MKRLLSALAVLVLVGAGCERIPDHAPTPYVEEPAPAPTPDPHGPEAKAGLITVAAPVASTKVSSPLSVTGEARGFWYFEASFPVELLDANGASLAIGVAQAQADWMTEDFVPFAATLTYPAPSTATGTLMLRKDNPSGMPENDDWLAIPVTF